MDTKRGGTHEGMRTRLGPTNPSASTAIQSRSSKILDTVNSGRHDTDTPPTTTVCARERQSEMCLPAAGSAWHKVRG